MKTILFRKYLPLRALAISLGLFASTAASQAVLVNWDTGIWNHGSGNVVGYQAGQTSGTSDLGNGITVAVFWTTSGTANGVAGENLTVSTVLAGGGPAKSLRIQQQGDSNNTNSNLSPLVNYSVLRLNFNVNVSLLGLTLYDIDTPFRVPVVAVDDNSWRDHIKVAARQSDGINPPIYRTVTLTGGPTVTGTVEYASAVSNFANNTTNFADVRGLNEAPNNGNTGNVAVGIAGNYNIFEILYVTSPGDFLGLTHGIGIGNLEVIPEPSSFALALVGMSLFLRRSRRKLA